MPGETAVRPQHTRPPTHSLTHSHTHSLPMNGLIINHLSMNEGAKSAAHAFP